MTAQDLFRTGPLTFGVRRYRPSDREAVVGLWKSRFGCTDELAADWLEEATSDYLTACFVASPAQHGRVLGFGITTVTNEETTDGWLADGYYGKVDLPEIDLEQRTAVMHIGVTRPECEGEGVATELWKHRLAYARENDAAQAIGTSWHREDHVDSSVLFEKFGFEPAKRVKNYYDGDRDDCPDCDGQCTCDATVYWREL
ncbi:GNAT family N-acetyltransferase [Natrinema thermotolerans]|uniref:GNAT family N-acetyltransferase n=1 Tax=Natrinema thermotolerans TaxID=121872 RepID=UPI00067929D6|nr:GNAT family N-acetyltransferase [Natrinema thermotolerans]QCC57208.1 N-acetyltransferase [Natrinema thermotolerans]